MGSKVLLFDAPVYLSYRAALSAVAVDVKLPSITSVQTHTLLYLPSAIIPCALLYRRNSGDKWYRM